MVDNDGIEKKSKKSVEYSIDFVLLPLTMRDLF